MWQRIRKWFKDSEVLFWARLQMFIGAVAGVVTFVEPSVLAPIIPADWFPYFLVINGVATEILRRRRDETMK